MTKETPLQKILSRMIELEKFGKPLTRWDMTFEEYKELYWDVLARKSPQAFQEDQMPYPAGEDPVHMVGHLFGVPLYVHDEPIEVLIEWAQKVADGESQDPNPTSEQERVETPSS